MKKCVKFNATTAENTLDLMRKSVSIAEACLIADIDFTFNVSQLGSNLQPIMKLIHKDFQDDAEYITNNIGD